jgi:hypothetical protein
MTEIGSASVRAAPGRGAVRAAASAVRRYLAKQFPFVQAVSIALTPIAAWLAFGKIDGHVSFGWPALAAALLVVLMFLQYRLVDDVCTYCNAQLGGPGVIPARPRPMIAGALATLPLVLVLQPHARPLLFALAVIAVMFACSFVLAIGDRLPLSRFVAQVPFVELVPVGIFAYVYVAWSDASGRTLAALEVIAVLGTLTAGFQFWKWSRHLGDDPIERIYRVSWNTVRWILLAVLAAGAAFNVLLYAEAGLSPAYLAYQLAAGAAFAVLAAPRGRPDTTRPAWAGLGYPAALLAGLYLQLVAAA